jgi:3-hydroxybutyryl-CoA dehydratase
VPGSERRDLRFEEISVGDVFTVEALLDESRLDAFATLSGDHSPIHQDPAVARHYGFEGRLAYGFQVLALFSAIVGANFHTALCTSVSVDFIAPAFAGDHVMVRAEVVQMQTAMRTVSLAVKVFRGDSPLIRGKLLTRFL